MAGESLDELIARDFAYDPIAAEKKWGGGFYGKTYRAKNQSYDENKKKWRQSGDPHKSRALHKKKSKHSSITATETVSGSGKNWEDYKLKGAGSQRNKKYQDILKSEAANLRGDYGPGDRHHKKDRKRLRSGRDSVRGSTAVHLQGQERAGRKKREKRAERSGRQAQSLLGGNDTAERRANMLKSGMYGLSGSKFDSAIKKQGTGDKRYASKRRGAAREIGRQEEEQRRRISGG